MRERELVRLPRITDDAAAALVFCTLFVTVLEKREALAGDGEPIALLGLQAIAAACELAICWFSRFSCSVLINCSLVASGE